jgi:hypothetical protein
MTISAQALAAAQSGRTIEALTEAINSLSITSLSSGISLLGPSQAATGGDRTDGIAVCPGSANQSDFKMLMHPPRVWFISVDRLMMFSSRPSFDRIDR